MIPQLLKKSPYFYGNLKIIAVPINPPLFPIQADRPNNKLTNSMHQGPSWEASVFSPSQEIIFILWNPEVYYSIHKSLPLPILNKSDPIHVSPSYLLKIHFNIVFPTTPKSSEWSLYLKSLHQTSPVPHTRYMPCPPHSSWFDHPYIWWGLQIMRLLVRYSSPIHRYLVPLRPKYPPRCHTLEHPQPKFLSQYERPIFTSIQNKRFCTEL